MGVLKTKQPKLLKEFIWPAKMIHITTDTFSPFALFPQDAAQSLPDPSVQPRKRPLVTVFVIFKPAFQCLVQFGCNIRQTVAIAAPGMGAY